MIKPVIGQEALNSIHPQVQHVQCSRGIDDEPQSRGGHVEGWSMWLMFGRDLMGWYDGRRGDRFELCGTVVLSMSA